MPGAGVTLHNPPPAPPPTNDDAPVIRNEHLAVDVDQLSEKRALQLPMRPKPAERDVVLPGLPHFEMAGREEQREVSLQPWPWMFLRQEGTLLLPPLAGALGLPRHTPVLHCLPRSWAESGHREATAPRGWGELCSSPPLAPILTDCLKATNNGQLPTAESPAE